MGIVVLKLPSLDCHSDLQSLQSFLQLFSWHFYLSLQCKWFMLAGNLQMSFLSSDILLLYI